MLLDVIERASERPNPPCYRSRSLMKEDIDGASASYYWKKYSSKPDLSSVRDILGASPKSTYRRFPIKDHSLFTADIDLAQPKKNSFTTTRCTNPLDPNYNLPVCLLAPLPKVSSPVLPTNYIEDIAGTKPKKLISQESRDQKDAVENSTPSYSKRFLIKPVRNILQVDDINLPHRKLILPTWKPEIPGSQPRKLHWSKDRSDLALENRDILGSTSQRYIGSRSYSVFAPATHNSFSVSDISGAQASTLLRAFPKKACSMN
jgi:hypothetical protein